MTNLLSKKQNTNHSNMFTTTRDQVANWKKDLHSYEKSKQKLSWKMPPPVKIVREWEVKSKEYQFHPILQKYNDPVREKTVQRQEAVSHLSAFSKSRAKSIKYDREYDIINFSDKPQSKVFSKYHSVQRQTPKQIDGIEAQLPINNIKRKPVNQPHGTQATSHYSKRPTAGYSRRFNPLKVVNTDIRFIDNVSFFL
eukprot:TRINITY_DN3514_c0_g1_i1.p3 TRINITY_DN3514_c0_g1~~TRINITY_DN3514_c0_g1_i1.p3  ORF type:complete len:196 (-),score=12.43 TRINITY_DN3514_c0_g1_i1:690-1277(-)